LVAILVTSIRLPVRAAPVESVTMPLMDACYAEHGFDRNNPAQRAINATADNLPKIAAARESCWDMRSVDLN